MDLGRDFNFNTSGHGSSLFKFASFKYSNSRSKLATSVPSADANRAGQVPLEFIVEQEEDLSPSAAPVDKLEYAPAAAAAASASGRKASRERRTPATRRRKRERSDEDDDEDDGNDDDEEPFEDEDDDVQPRELRATRGGGQYVDITEYLCLPQSDAAVKLGLPVSTLSKRWKESAKARKWPFRKVAKLDKEIGSVLATVPQSGLDAGVLPPEIEEKLVTMLKERAHDLRKISIRI